MTSLRFLRAASFAVVAPLASASLALAQSTTEPIGDSSGVGKWAMAYGLVGLCVILGLINVCRPGKRKGDAPKPA